MDPLLARAAALRSEARLTRGMPRARLLSRAAEAERLAATIERMTSAAPSGKEPRC